MASKRMFALTIIDSDAFLDMPQSTQLLYFHLGMRADDDGFINNAKTIMRVAGCKEDDLKLLIAKKFVIWFESGVMVIKHWNINNYIQNDRYHETKYKEEKEQLFVDEKGGYTLSGGTPAIAYRDTENKKLKKQCIQDVSNVYPQVRLGKDSLGKDRLDLDKNRLVIKESIEKGNTPTLEEIKDFCIKNSIQIDYEKFYNYYESIGWVKGNTKITNWQAALKYWASTEPVKPEATPIDNELQEYMKKVGLKK